MNQPVFSDRVLRGRTRRLENKEDRKVWDHKVKLMVNTNKYTKGNGILYAVCKGKWVRISRKLYYDGTKSELR